MRPAHALLFVLGVAGLASTAAAQNAGTLYAPSVWDLQLGAHATELPTAQFIAYACGTNGGPPSIPLKDWRDYAQCRPEAGTGFHEVNFKYDNELELWAKANGLFTQGALYQYTSAYEIPVVVSALFDDDGFLRGIRMVTDPRVPVELREKGVVLGNFLQARYGDGAWECIDLPRREGEQPYLGLYQKQECTKVDTEAGLNIVVETHNYRRAGQAAVDPVNNMETSGQFESTTRFNVSTINPPADAAARIAAIAAAPAAGLTEKEQLVARAMNCPGCDLTGVNLKRADLRNANLAGANLTKVNLHEANLQGANLEGANLTSANLNGALMRLTNLRGATLDLAMMYTIRLDGADLTGASLTGGLAGHGQMARANFTDASMTAMDLRESRINDSTFVGADLTDAWMDDAQILRSDFSGATMVAAIMWRVNLTGAKFVGANCRSCDLISSNLRDADLTGADFSDARLTFVNFRGVKAEGAVFDRAALPSGFRPPQAAAAPAAPAAAATPPAR